MQALQVTWWHDAGTTRLRRDPILEEEPMKNDHISYLMVRIDPDKVTPLKGEAQSRDYLSKPARK
jgi:hypothetical protein